VPARADSPGPTRPAFRSAGSGPAGRESACFRKGLRNQNSERPFPPASTAGTRDEEVTGLGDRGGPDSQLIRVVAVK